MEIRGATDEAGTNILVMHQRIDNNTGFMKIFELIFGLSLRDALRMISYIIPICKYFIDTTVPAHIKLFPSTSLGILLEHVNNN
jgi:hypothetical protein